MCISVGCMALWRLRESQMLSINVQITHRLYNLSILVTHISFGKLSSFRREKFEVIYYSPQTQLPVLSSFVQTIGISDSQTSRIRREIVLVKCVRPTFSSSISMQSDLVKKSQGISCLFALHFETPVGNLDIKRGTAVFFPGDFWRENLSVCSYRQ